MAKVSVVDMTGKNVGDITLSDAIFGIKPNEAAVHAVVTNYLQTRDREPNLQRQEQRLEEAEESLSDRREQDATDRVAQQIQHRLAAESFSHQSQEATDTA